MKPKLAVLTDDESFLERFAEMDLDTEPFESRVLRNGSDEVEADVCGLLVHGASDALAHDFAISAIRECVIRNLPILASGSGAHMFNLAMGGFSASVSPEHVTSEDDRRGRATLVFLTPGAKTSSIIGGSGWLTLRCNHSSGLEHRSLARSLMPACISRDRFVEAFESPGHSWRIGVQWDILMPRLVPRGFDHLLLAFVERMIERAVDNI